ncbi:serine/threonine protein kinase [Mariniblastus sp.]|nr:serine/threonine protein kinase [Mariniblastus sp.]
MPDDQEVSKLISQSMRRKLSDNEQQQVSESLEQNEESKKFAELSKQIHQSVAGLRPSEETESKSKLPDEMRERLRNSVAQAVEEKLSLSQAGLIQSSATFGSSKLELTSTPEATIDTTSRFHPVRKLASGGIGEVWVAKDEKLGRNVVIKRLNSAAKEWEQAWERFQREAEITGLLEHPNIVPLYMFGLDERTQEPFYAMRFVGQRNLADAIEEHHDRVEAGQADSLSLHRLLNIFIDVCQAIAYAHSRGVIHRDLKPENVAIDKFGQVIVLDWGLAKVMENSELALKLNDQCKLTDSSMIHTAHGEVIGTPVYMSPEQAEGKIDLIDTRTDVYGLGGILFSILTGKAPHADIAKAEGSGFREIVKQIGEAPTPVPNLSGDVPAGLESICVQALSRKRHLRFDSVSEFGSTVEEWMVGQSGKKLNYEKLRMEGRELRADLQTRVHDLERNVGFCMGLPPVQELIKPETEEEEKIWRKRMSDILLGLIEANPGYDRIVYGRFEDDSYAEIVCVEKISGPGNGTRSTPKGRLQTRKQNDFLKKIRDQLPGEVRTALVSRGKSKDECIKIGLQSGVPVYDRDNEEVFGFILATRDIYELVDKQLSHLHSASEIIVACEQFDVISQKVEGQLVLKSRSKLVEDIAPWFIPAVEHLKTNSDFIDDSNSEIYGARICFDPNESGLMFLLKL